MKSLPITREDIAAALATELRPRMRKRLIAVRAVLCGETYTAAAHIAGVSSMSVSHWVHSVTKSGYPALLRDGSSRHIVAAQMPAEPIASIRQEIEAALARAQPVHLSKRLMAVRGVLEGQTFAAAARVAGVNPASASRWLRVVQEGGCAALLRGSDLGRPLVIPMTRQQIAAAQEAINDMLSKQPKPAQQCRLHALGLGLSGKVHEAAHVAQVQTVTIRRWLTALSRRGVTAYLRQFDPAHQRGKLDADPGTLRAAAREAKDHHIRKCFLALGYLAEGLSVLDAAVRTGLSEYAVRNNLRRYQQGGIPAIRAFYR